MKKILLILCFVIPTLSQAGTWHEGQYFSMWGYRKYKVYLPDSYQTLQNTKTMSVVVALHGCMQNAESFSGGSRLEKWAENLNFAVIYPEQSKNDNIYSCWNWFFPFNQMKYTGEAQLIMGSIDKSVREFNLSQDKLFILGMSAGAAEVNVLINCYPERFKAFASHHGVMYKGAEDSRTARDIIQTGPVISPEVAALKGFSCSHIINSEKLIPGVVIHGKKGAVMRAVHASKVEEEVLALNDYIDNGMRDRSLHLVKSVKKVSPKDSYSYTLTKWKTENKTLLIKILVDELGHAWSGGDNQWEFNDPSGPDATKIILDFFKLYGL